MPAGVYFPNSKIIYLSGKMVQVLMTSVHIIFDVSGIDIFVHWGVDSPPPNGNLVMPQVRTDLLKG